MLHNGLNKLAFQCNLFCVVVRFKYLIMTDYQNMILEALQIGARLKCTEGVNYKCWLVYPNGEIKNIRRDSAEKVCKENEIYLVFGELDGIRWR